MNSPELVRAAQRGEPGAIDHLVADWLPSVLRWCARLAPAGVDSEDAAHDVLMAMLDHLGSLQQAEAFPAWLYSITRRTIKKHGSRAWLRRWVPGISGPDLADPGADPLHLAGEAELVMVVRRAIASLPLHYREVVVLHDLEERSDAEVAQLLGIPKGTVKSRLRRGRMQLRGRVPQLGLLLDAAEEGTA